MHGSHAEHIARRATPAARLISRASAVGEPGIGIAILHKDTILRHRIGSAHRVPAIHGGGAEILQLKPGLWIDVEFRHDDKDNQARRVMVMRPVGGPDTAPEKEQPSSSERANPGR
jgi:hypothetical protein